MFTKLRKQEKGFTIIEVLIVLAIAGLIMLVVFLAVPALQRNSRNSQRKSDVSALLGGISEYTSNNNGSLPTTATQVVNNVKLGYYSGTGTGQGNVNLVNTSSPALTTNATDDRVVIVAGGRCNGAAAVAGGARQISILYQLETSGTPTPTCQES